MSLKRAPMVMVWLGLVVSLGACSGTPDKQGARACAGALDTAYSELDFAEAQGFGGSVNWAKAAGLLTRAKTHQTLEKYQSCTRIAKEARTYIELSKVQK